MLLYATSTGWTVSKLAERGLTTQHFSTEKFSRIELSDMQGCGDDFYPMLAFANVC